MAYVGAATTDTGMSSLMSTYYDKLALETLMPALVVYNLAEKKSLPKNEGKIIIFHRYFSMISNPSAASLTEGGSGAWPTWGKMSATPVSATLQDYGAAFQTSDFIEMTAVSNVVEEAIKQMMADAANIVDKRIMETAYGTSSIPSGAGFPLTFATAQGYSIGALSTVTSACSMSVDAIKAAVRDLKVLNAKPMDSGYFSMITHPAQTYSLMGDSAWQNAYMYTTPENLRKGNVGRIYNAEVFETTNVFSTTSGVGTASVAAYFAVLLGKGALAVTEIDGGIKTIVKRPNQYDTANPLNQWSSIGWKIRFAPVILNPSCGRVIVTV